MTEAGSALHALERLEALRAAGAEAREPMRFHYLQSLVRRSASAPPALQPLLAAKLQGALDDCTARLQTPATVRRKPGGQNPVCAPLAALNHHIREARQATAEPPGARRLRHDEGDASEMRSVRQFRQAWSRVRAEQQVDKAVVRAPDNAGPLNSHSLVLRSLALMRELSPDYLQHFLAQADTLLWLEQARRKAGLPAVGNARRRR